MNRREGGESVAEHGALVVPSMKPPQCRYAPSNFRPMVSAGHFEARREMTWAAAEAARARRGSPVAAKIAGSVAGPFCRFVQPRARDPQRGELRSQRGEIVAGRELSRKLSPKRRRGFAFDRLLKAKPEETTRIRIRLAAAFGVPKSYASHPRRGALTRRGWGPLFGRMWWPHRGWGTLAQMR